MNIWLIVFLCLCGFSIFINVLGYVMEKIYKKKMLKKMKDVDE